MAKPLKWKEGEGYDVHLLRGGPESKKLVDALDLDSSQTALASFIPNLEGGVDNHGVELNASAGILKALKHPDATFPRVTNFLLSAFFDSLDGTQETEIRVHVHDTVKDIWLTPSTLTIHQGVDEKCRFTVLARFNDDAVGDITDWPQLSYKSVDPVTHADSIDVLVSPSGVLKAVTPGKSADITVTLNLTSPPTSKSATAKVFAKPSWADVAKNARVQFVAGPVRPNENDLDSVKAVVENAPNILFVAEGFRQDQRGDFNNLVWKVTEELRTKDYLQPFKLLKNSINYWSVFIPSKEEGISLLGDYAYELGHFTGGLVPLPRRPLDSATEWSLTEMIHKVGLPVLEELDFGPFLSNHVHRWKRLYGAQVTQARTSKFYRAWLNLALRSPLNERDSAFGMAISDRPRASQGERWSVTSLQYDFRRTSETSILNFVQSLTYAGHPIGSTWKPGGKDFGLVAFACLSDIHAGQQRRGLGYITASLGRNRRADLRPVPGRGLDIKTAAPEKHSRTVFASVVAHECGHAFGLGDEYGDGEGTDPAYGPTVSLDPNLQAKGEITSTTTDPATGTKKTVFDKTKNIKWLWPRVIKAGMLDGAPTRFGTGFRVPLRKGHGRAFRGGDDGDMVWFREWPVVRGASFDPFLGLPRSIGLFYKVKTHDDDSVTVNLVDSSGVVVDVDAEVIGVDTGGTGPATWAYIIPNKLFSPGLSYALVCPRTAAGIELKLVAEPTLKHIEVTGPLTAEPGFDPALCVADRRGRGFSSQTPTNLPPLSRTPRTRADIIGIYEGGSYHDCGVFRPAGRCNMRTGIDKVIPFCHVCRYLIVDRVDPTRHGKLDKLYPEVSA